MYFSVTRFGLPGGGEVKYNLFCQMASFAQEQFSREGAAVSSQQPPCLATGECVYWPGKGDWMKHHHYPLKRVSVVINMLDSESGNQCDSTSAQHAMFIIENSFRLQAVIITNVVLGGQLFFLKGPGV